MSMLEIWNTSGTLLSSNSTNNPRISSSNEHVFVGLVLVVVSATGLFINMLVVVFTFTKKVAKQQICILFANGACGDVLFLAIFTFWVSPMIIFQTSYANNMFILAAAFSVAVYTSLFLAVNRFTAVRFPLKYPVLFDARHTKFYVVGIWIAAWISSIPYGVPGCSCFVDFVNYRMEYEDTVCGSILYIVSDCVFPFFTITVFSLNIATFVKIKSRRTLPKQGKAIASAPAERKRKRENRFFYQAVSIALSMDTLVLSFDLLSRLSGSRWWTYFTTMLYLSLVLTMNGLIILLLNDELRHQLVKLKFWKKKDVKLLVNNDSNIISVAANGNEKSAAKVSPNVQITKRY